MRAIVTMLVAALGAAECERTPPEQVLARPAPGAPTVVASSQPPVVPAPTVDSVAVVPAGRCVLATPAQPPAPVAPGPAPGCPADPEMPSEAARSLPILRVVFPDVPPVAVEAEVVRSQHDAMRGLMYRKSMAEDRGMLFDLGTREDHKFWMHNTCIPLDLLYIDQDGLIVGIVENAPTLNDESRGVGCPSSYVLEVNAGWARKHGVKAGQRTNVPEVLRGG